MMRKAIFVIIVLLVAITNKTYSQSFQNRLHFEASTGVGAKITVLHL